MKKRLLGTLTVSEVGMGCMGFSHGYGVPPEESYAVEAIRKAFDFGCTLFDTAETYGREQFYPGHNEELVGKTIAPFRKEAVLATKLHLGPKEERADKSTYQVVKEHLAQSMKRLQTDYIDLYYLHRLSEDVPVEEVAQAMGRLIQEGLIRGWGLSQVSAETLDRAHRVTPVSAVQNLYNMVERDCEGDIFPYCLEHHIGVVPFSPIASGLLSGKVTAQTKFEGDDVRKFVPQLSRETWRPTSPLSTCWPVSPRRRPAPRPRLPWPGCSTNTPMWCPSPALKTSSAFWKTWAGPTYCSPPRSSPGWRKR